MKHFRCLFHTIKMQASSLPLHRRSRIEQLKMMNYSMEINEEKVEALVHTSGLHYSDFDIGGKPKPWQLMKLLESARYYCHHWPIDDTGRNFRDYAELTSDRMTFLVTSRMDIDRCIYDLNTPKNPLDVKVQSGYVGNSSLNSIATVQTLDGQRLLSNINQVVSIDRATRRPKQLPDWWREKYSKCGENASPLKFEKCSKPEGLVPFEIKVVRSDQDGNGHTNWSSYVRYSLDCIYHNAKHGRIDNFNDFNQLGLQSMELLHIGECFDDDLLSIYAWNKQQTQSTVCVHVEKDDKVIFQGTYTFYEELIL